MSYEIDDIDNEEDLAAIAADRQGEASVYEWLKANAWPGNAHGLLPVTSEVRLNLEERWASESAFLRKAVARYGTEKRTLRRIFLEGNPADQALCFSNTVVGNVDNNEEYGNSAEYFSHVLALNEAIAALGSSNWKLINNAFRNIALPNHLLASFFQSEAVKIENKFLAIIYLVDQEEPNPLLERWMSDFKSASFDTRYDAGKALGAVVSFILTAPKKEKSSIWRWRNLDAVLKFLVATNDLSLSASFPVSTLEEFNEFSMQGSWDKSSEELITGIRSLLAKRVLGERGTVKDEDVNRYLMNCRNSKHDPVRMDFVKFSDLGALLGKNFDKAIDKLNPESIFYSEHEELEPVREDFLILATYKRELREFQERKASLDRLKGLHEEFGAALFGSLSLREWFFRDAKRFTWLSKCCGEADFYHNRIDSVIPFLGNGTMREIFNLQAQKLYKSNPDLYIAPDFERNALERQKDFEPTEKKLLELKSQMEHVAKATEHVSSKLSELINAVNQLPEKGDQHALSRELSHIGEALKTIERHLDFNSRSVFSRVLRR